MNQSKNILSKIFYGGEDPDNYGIGYLHWVEKRPTLRYIRCSDISHFDGTGIHFETKTIPFHRIKIIFNRGGEILFKKDVEGLVISIPKKLFI
ncbi:MAG: hypothetical protein APG12_00098 [Candidatus Methanofastidiosum methylothiophilum]|uniref:MJ1316 RNA cyclic group end recognition domain-containing protein n=1 Tax=Candidatus Methanofastidiosum methylothiophilum TaxID=1705564 RepID=A0A150J2J2_9EURY|nr:MAG: hypothetical protein APG10_00258 [Candidatus Methanofastidiosum methylthiophilus]KYC48788.1 MAG: hypothetical protein APG11_00099 [Candidatus Methanofastidiosum methylthiophilus]KYC51436.1 MAG: hypothetical protein APG12_00098 [Candidatus Methanofastidiosum methylthiophilus]